MSRCLTAPALALALLAAVPVARATSLTPQLPLSLEGDESVATTDDARALLFNPAAVGIRYPEELFEGFARYNAHREWNSTLFTRGSFGIIALRQRDTSQTYGAALAFGSERLRFGWNPYWLVSGQPVRERVLDHQVGMLSRPAPWMSMGFTIDRLFQPTFRQERRARHYTVGLGLRPLALSSTHAWGPGTRLTLSADVTIVDDGDWTQSRVRVAGEFEPLQGVALQATVADHNNFRFGVTFRGVNCRRTAATPPCATTRSTRRTRSRCTEARSAPSSSRPGRAAWPWCGPAACSPTSPWAAARCRAASGPFPRSRCGGSSTARSRIR